MKYNLSKIMLKAWKVYRKTKNISFADGVGVVMATEIIVDLKKQLEEAKEEAKEWEESWNMSREQVRALSRQSDIISMVLRMDDVELLDLAFGFVRGCYNQQIKKEQEAENNGEM